MSRRSNATAAAQFFFRRRRLTSVPLLLNVDGPLPLEVLVLIVVREEGVDVVSAALDEAGGRVLGGREVGVDLVLGRIGANHVGHLVHRDPRPRARETDTS